MDILWYQQRLIVIYHDLSTKQASSKENLLMKKKTCDACRKPVHKAVLRHSLPCIYDHETYTRQVIASGLQDKDRRNPLFQTSLSRHEAAGNR